MVDFLMKITIRGGFATEMAIYNGFANENGNLYWM